MGKHLPSAAFQVVHGLAHPHILWLRTACTKDHLAQSFASPTFDLAISSQDKVKVPLDSLDQEQQFGTKEKVRGGSEMEIWNALK